MTHYLFSPHGSPPMSGRCVAADGGHLPAAAQHVDRCSSRMDSCTAMDRGRARGIRSPGRGVALAAPLRARCR
eukprot:4785372-Prymnesium_polylepis.1